MRPDRFGAGGYFRIMTRPDFQGGNGRLGLWNLYGRLLNEGPYAALELKLDVLQAAPGTKDVWTSVHTKVEGGSVMTADPNNGRLDNFRLSQLYVRAGNLLLDDVVWQLGTLDSYFGDLGLYDMKPAQLFFETVGLSARYDSKHVEVLAGFGDSGYFLRGSQYNTIFTLGGSVRLRLGEHVEVGGGGQLFVEPKVEGNRFAPHQTPGVTYEDFQRREVVLRMFEQDMRIFDMFPRPVATDASSWKLIGYLGFGKLGPIRWNNFFLNYMRLHPDNFYRESFSNGGVTRDFTVYVKELTDDRFQLNLGNEMQLTLIPRYLDAIWAVLYGRHENRDNTLFAGEDNRSFVSAVVRLQAYATETLHFLVESSVAKETSERGNLWREHVDSVFRNNRGTADDRGLEIGDTDVRNTWQLKLGPVLNPLGRGVYTRPSLRLLMGVQYSNMHQAFGAPFSESLDQYNEFAAGPDRHWHTVVALEAETWF